jgi:hypothetical protein
MLLTVKPRVDGHPKTTATTMTANRASGAAIINSSTASMTFKKSREIADTRLAQGRSARLNRLDVRNN